MNVLSSTSYRNYFLLGLSVILLTAWFSVGGHHPDEYFQVLEFAAYKMGMAKAADLPWEFGAQCRPALQPFIVVAISKSLQAIGLFNPFFVTLILRAGIGLLSWWITCRLILLVLPKFKTEKASQIFIACCFLLWFVPYINVRFSSENLSAQLFLLALSILLPMREPDYVRKISDSIFVGLLLGAALFIRLQIGFAFVGLGIWLYFQNWKLRDWMLMCFAGIAAIAVCVVIDYWFYGEWIFTPLNYFKVNIIENKAAAYGVFPFWAYFSFFFEIAVPPLSILLILFFLRGVYKRPFHLLSLVCITFLLGHFAIAHKEMRFLFPMCLPFIFMACIGLDFFLQRYAEKRYYRWIWGVLIFMNIGLLIFRSLTPAHEIVKYYEFIYNHCKRQNTILVAFNQSPYNLATDVDFYRPKNLTIKVIKDLPELQTVLNNAGGQSILLYDKLPASPSLAAYKLKKVYSLIPDWILRFNFNHWQDRSYIIGLYEVKP